MANQWWAVEYLTPPTFAAAVYISVQASSSAAAVSLVQGSSGKGGASFSAKGPYSTKALADKGGATGVGGYTPPPTPAPVPKPTKTNVNSGGGAADANPPSTQGTGPNGTGGGAAATSGATAPIFEQPQFDPRIYTLPFGADNGTLTRGYMKWDSGNNITQYGKYQALVHFLYNPTTVAISYSCTSNDQTVANQYSAPGGSTNVVAPIQQSLSFSLLFDRTFELWGQYDANGIPLALSPANVTLGAMNSAAQQGVNVDIRAMKQLTGQLSSLGAGGGNMTTKNPVLKQGPMFPCYTWLYFGNQTSDFFYYGYITDFNVTVTHWSQFMVPMRCAIDVDFSILPNQMTTAAPNKPGTNASPNKDLWWSTMPLTTAPTVGTPITTTFGAPVSATVLGSGSIAGIGGT